jgi:hypothetical protein
MNNDNFEIRTYGKSELAMLYFPNAETKKGALNNLNFYINKKKGLRRKLLKLGSPPKAHSYLPIEVEIIINALGEPYGKTY